MYLFVPKNKKLSRPWEQYIVTKVLDEEPFAAIYEISQGQDKTPRPVHIDHLKLYLGWNPITKWWSEEPQPNMKTFFSHIQTPKDKWIRKDPDEVPSSFDSGTSVK